MITIWICFICFFASSIGAICGIGGGVIIKPVLDSFGLYPVATINFLSGCTVLSMTTYSVVRSKYEGRSQIKFKTMFVLAVGAAVGGIFGNSLFRIVQQMCSVPKQAGAVQAAVLVVILSATFLYTRKKTGIRTLCVSNIWLRLVIGFSLGGVSSFLGIGGGPFNVAVLSFFFSMDTKKAAENSLYIICFSQLFNLLSSIVSRTIPAFPLYLLLLMVCGGIAGGAFGRTLNKRLDGRRVEFLFSGLVIVLILINGYNFINLV